MKVKTELPSLQSTSLAGTAVFLPPFHPQIRLPEIPQLFTASQRPFDAAFRRIE